jgi:hypothetical protein
VRFRQPKSCLTLFFLFLCSRSYAQSRAGEESGLPYVRGTFHLPSKIFAAFAPYFALAHFPNVALSAFFPFSQFCASRIFPIFLPVHFLHFLLAHFICLAEQALSGPWVSRSSPGSGSAKIRINLSGGILIRILNADLDPDPVVKKLRLVLEKHILTCIKISIWQFFLMKRKQFDT